MGIIPNFDVLPPQKHSAFLSNFLLGRLKNGRLMQYALSGLKKRKNPESPAAGADFDKSRVAVSLKSVHL